MLLEELYQLTQWIQKNIREANIVNLYQQLHKVLQQNTQQQPQQPFEEQKDNLQTALQQVPLQDLTTTQIHVLHVIGIGEHVGQEGYDRVEDILVRNPVDIATAANKINQSVDSLNKGIKWANEVDQRLKDIVDEHTVELDRSSSLIRVHFMRNADISDVYDFKYQGKNWYTIGRAVSRVHGKAPQDVQIVNAGRGSIVLDLLADPVIVGTITTIVLGALKGIQMIQKMMLQQQELRKLRIDTAIAEKQLSAAEKNMEEAITQVKDEAKRDIKETLEKELNLSQKAEGDQSIKTDLERAVDQLVDFMARGGDVEFIPPSEPEDEDEEDAGQDEYREQRAQIREAAEQIHALRQETVEYLEEKPRDEDTDNAN